MTLFCTDIDMVRTGKSAPRITEYKTEDFWHT